MVIGIVGHLEKPDVPRAVESLIAVLARRDISFLLDEKLRPAFPELPTVGRIVPSEELRDGADVAIAFGGDGTMLSTSRFLAGSGVPLLGVNLGKLGFLAEFSVDALEETIEELVAGHTHKVERTLLHAEFPQGNNSAESEHQPLIALNDIVIDKRGGSLMLKMEVYINEEYLGSYTSDGLIVATPTGSTAYALAAGGPVVVPDAGVFVIVPIAPHMLTARPVVIPDTATIDIYATSNHDGNETAHVYADGQIHRNIPMPARVTIRRHGATACLVKRTATTYFDILRAKLLWGREPVLNAQPNGEFGRKEENNNRG